MNVILIFMPRPKEVNPSHRDSLNSERLRVKDDGYLQHSPLISGGALISWIGALMGALASFCIARLFGNVALRKIVRNQKAVEFIRHAGEKRGFYVILLSRLLPFISFDIISYMAGLSGIRQWTFILATALGMLPATIIYTFIGHEIPVMEGNFPIVLTCTVFFIFILVVFSLVRRVRKKI